jgi:hypothetical protein
MTVLLIDRLCEAAHATGFFCTLPRGHTGAHVATIGPYEYGGHELVQWPRDDEPPTIKPEKIGV